MEGATFNGIEIADRTGRSVSGAGDVNGDGLDDLLIGASRASAGGNDRGRSYLVYGQPENANPLSGGLNLINLGGTLAGATFNGIGNGYESGWSVSGAGDINGDSLNDFLIAAPFAGSAKIDSGQTYLVYGRSAGSPLSGAFTLADVGGAVAGATFDGIAEDDKSGWSISGAGDVNGDGLDDLLIGSMYANNDQGQVYLVYGQDNDNPLSGSLDLADLGAALAGAIFNGIQDGDYAGRDVSGAGDVNGDGLADLLIAAPYADAAGSNRGESYLVYGRRESRVIWIDPGNDAWDDNLNWFGFEGPVAGDDVFIQPTNGLTVSGPTSATQMDSLTLGAQQAGTANLVIDPAGTLLIDQKLTIEADGRLAGSGTVIAMGGITNEGEIDLGSQGLNLAGGAMINTGLVRGGGTIDNPLINSATSEVRVAAGQRMHLTDTGAQVNAGRIDVIGNAMQAAEIEFDGGLTSAALTGNITARHAIVRFNNGLINRGTVGISFGTSDIYGDIDNNLGTITVSGTGNVTFYDDLINDGTVKVSRGSTAVFFWSVSGSGGFTGVGTIFLEGDLSPGSSPGAMSFGGDVILGESSATLIELAGTANGEYDRLLVAGALEVSGALEVQLFDGFTPAGLATFRILNATDLAGAFTSVLLPELSGNLRWDHSHLYSSGTLSVIPEPATLTLLAVGTLLVCRRTDRIRVA